MGSARSARACPNFRTAISWPKMAARWIPRPATTTAEAVTPAAAKTCAACRVRCQPSARAGTAWLANARTVTPTAISRPRTAAKKRLPTRRVDAAWAALAPPPATSKRVAASRGAAFAHRRRHSVVAAASEREAVAEHELRGVTGVAEVRVRLGFGLGPAVAQLADEFLVAEQHVGDAVTLGARQPSRDPSVGLRQMVVNQHRTARNHQRD